MKTRFIAREPLFIGYARAHNPGDEVDADAVKEHGWDAQVDRVRGSASDTDAQAEQTNG